MTDYSRLLDDLSEAAREAGEAITAIVARGFDVTASSSGAAEVVVAPGYALDPCGREVLLTAGKGDVAVDTSVRRSLCLD